MEKNYQVAPMKDFILVGNKNALTWTETFPLFIEGKARYGYTSPNYMILPDTAEKWCKVQDGKKLANMQGVCKWITTLPVKQEKRVKPIATTKEYDHFDNNPEIINTDSIYEIPEDYEGLIGCPIDIMRYLPEGYEIVGKLMNGNGPYDFGKPYVNGKMIYARIVIRKK